MVNQSVCMLPETVDIITNSWQGDLTIRNHKVKTKFGLFDWLMRLPWYNSSAFREMKENGIDWYSVAECIATELEDEYIFGRMLYWVVPTYPSYLPMPKCITFAKTKEGRMARLELIHTIRHCDSYEDFADKFRYKIMSELIKIVRNAS